MAHAGFMGERTFFKRFPHTLPFTRITLNWFKKQNYYIRTVTLSDLPELLAIERACWPLHLRAKKTTLIQRIKQGSGYVISHNKCIAGVIYTQRIVHCDVLYKTSYRKQHLLHDPKHPVLQLTGLNVLPDPQYSGFGDILLSFMLQQALLIEDIQLVSSQRSG
jgi:rhizoxin synthesis polyketide synthase/nonribosomal peptide synthetase RhiA